jgi:ribosomal protein S27E
VLLGVFCEASHALQVALKTYYLVRPSGGATMEEASKPNPAQTIPVVQCPKCQALTELHKIPDRTLEGTATKYQVKCSGCGNSYAAPLHGHKIVED